jgi:flagellar assembly factor FliW
MTILTATSLIYRSPKLGDVPYGPDDVIRFPQGLPGFERLREFLLVTREECAPFVLLASLEDPEVTLPLVPLAATTLGLAAPADALRALGQAGEDALGYYAVVSIGVDAREIIANLRAPVVVNLDTRLGCQVILPDETLPLAAPLPL